MTSGAFMPHFESQDPMAERAATFWERRRFGDWNEADQAELDAWLAESSLHRVAYLRVEAIAARTDALAAVHDFRSFARPNATAPAGRAGFRFRYVTIPFLAAASIALFAAFGIPFVEALLEPPVRSLSTDVGGRTFMRFVDGTEFELNTNSAIRYRMSNNERTVWLDKGEAWFHVAHNPKNPFAVVIGKHRVEDVGTEFVVRREPGRVEVALLAGAAALGTDSIQAVTLRPGDDAIATPVSVSVIRKTQQELADQFAWRNGVLVFRNATLADAFREINRYNTTKLVIADPSIEGVKITTDLKADDLEKFVRLTEGVLNLRADREGNEILFSRRGHALDIGVAAKAHARRLTTDTVRP